MKKENILILLDYFFGPIQCDWTDEQGRQITKIDVVDADEEVQRLNKEANALWLTLFTPTEFTEDNPSGFVFDETREKEIAPELLSLIEKLIARLEEINDGSYVIEDRETPRLKALISSKR